MKAIPQPGRFFLHCLKIKEDLEGRAFLELQIILMT